MTPRLADPSPARRLLAAAAAIAAVAALVMGSAPQAAYATVTAVTCANTTADDNTIQTALNAASAGDTVHVDGPCQADATITVPDSITFEGDGDGTIIKMANGANLKALVASSTWSSNFTSTNTGQTIRRFVLDGNVANNASVASGGAVLVLRAYNSRFTDLDVENGDRDGILISNASSNGTALTGTSVNSVIERVNVHDMTEVGVHVVDGGNAMTDWAFSDSWVHDTGTGFSTIYSENGAGWNVTNVHTYGTSVDAVHVERCFGTRLTALYVEDFGKQATNNTTYHGIYCKVQGDSGTVIANNFVGMYTTLPAAGNLHYIEAQENYSTAAVAVTGNTVRGAGSSSARETGITYDANGGAMQVASTGNLTYLMGTNRTTNAGVTLSAGN